MAQTVAQEVAAAKAAAAAKKAADAKAAAAATAAKQKASDAKMLADAQALLAKQKQNLASLEKLQKDLNPTPTSGAIPGFTPLQINPVATPGAVQGPMIGNNLGRDAAYALGAGMDLTPTQLAAAEAYNVEKGLNPDGSAKKKEAEITVDKDAYAILEEAFKFYGLESLVGTIKGYMQQNIGANEAKLKLKSEPQYLARFDGNTKRVAAGLNALDESTYLELENDYSETLRAYGLSDYFGVATDATSRLARQKEMAKVIGADISAVEFKTRVSTAVTKVKNADINTKDAFKALYGINDTELVKFFLDPAKGSEELKIKATAAEISGSAVTAGLAGTSLGTAEELARLGVDKAEALTGYGTIAGYLQRSGFLGDIYSKSGITYGRTDAESDVFKQTASAKRKREMLSGMETAAFSGESGRLRTGKQEGNAGTF
jgi:hypothetical protein